MSIFMAKLEKTFEGTMDIFYYKFNDDPLFLELKSLVAKK